LLSFFAQLEPDRADYGDRAFVAFFPASTKLARTAPPAGAASTKDKIGLLTPKLRLTVPPSEGPLIEALQLNSDESSAYHDEVFLGPIPEGRHHMLLGWPTAATHHGIQGKRFLAQFDSDHRIDFQMGDYNTLRYYIDGDAVDTATLKST